MAGGGGGVAGVAVAALGAGVSRIAGSGTCGGRYLRGVAVARCRDGFGLGCLTRGAGVGLDTGSGTGGSCGDLAAVIAMAAGGAAEAALAVAPAVGTSGAADTAGTAGPCMTHQLATDCTVALAVVGAVGAGGGVRSIAQGQCTVAVNRQGKGHLHTAGHKHFLTAAAAGRIQRRTGSRGIIALGHVPIGVVASLYRNIAVAIKGCGQLAIRELIAAQIGAILLAGIVAAVNVAEQVIVHHIVGAP